MFQDNFKRLFHKKSPSVFYSMILLLLSFVLPLNAEAETYAFLIGNQNYKNKCWEILKTPHSDVEVLADILRTSYDYKVTVKMDLTRGEIVDQLEYYKKKLSENDNLLIYYAGHGHLREDGGYWIGIRGKKESRGDWLHYKTISELLDYKMGMNARHVLIIADSCYAGAAYRGVKLAVERKKNENYNRFIERIIQCRSRKILSSGGDQPVVDTTLGSQHSIFAYEFLAQLKKNAKYNHKIFAQELRDSIAPDVFERTMRYIRDAKPPEHKIIYGAGDEGGDFLFNPVSLVGPPIENETDSKASPQKHQKRPAKSRFFATNYGIVVDQKTGLEWLFGPNQDMTWTSARNWVKNQKRDGGRWQMPTKEELKTLYQMKAGEKRITPLLRVTGHWIWSKEKRDSKNAYYYYYAQGSTGWKNINKSLHTRALAVRKLK
jgi:hypothetical protein